ncbi:hypothetical protein V5O48_011448 [Marasmius crinis-equi]|uniref:Uncharacterized protein n=1 Tax=Marasmius crinis-equi TaxID=585013 RepID=A0ABR3F5K3_9AGAR
MIKSPPAHVVAKPNPLAFRRPTCKSGMTWYTWRARMWLEGTFALSVMEPWEKYLVLSIFFLVVCVVLFTLSTVLARILPFQLIPTLSLPRLNLWKQEQEAIPTPSTYFWSMGRLEGRKPFNLVVGNYSARIPSNFNLLTHFLKKSPIRDDYI